MDQVDAQAVKRWVASAYAEAMQAHSGNDTMLVRRGLVADKEARRVELLALATGLTSQPCEFFLVAPYGRDYESLAVSMAAPDDIHAALEFIGLEAGRPVDYRAMLYWPKGELVKLTYSWEETLEDGTTVWRSMRAEDAVEDLQKEATLPHTGLMFVGSRQVQPTAEAEARYGASVGGEIATTYNDEWTVLDVPGRAEQGAVYGSRVPADGLPWTAGQHLRIILEPLLPAGQQAVTDARLVVSGPAGAASPAAFSFRLTSGHDTLLEAGSFDQLLAFIGQEQEAGRYLYLTLKMERQLPLGPLAELMKMVDAMAERDVIRLEPSDEELYYRALLPQPRWRSRSERIVQPLEVFLAADGTGRLIVLEELFVEGEPEVKETTHRFAGREELAALVKAEELKTDTWFLFAGTGVTYGQVLDYQQDLQESLPVLFVFTPLAGAGEAAAPLP